MKLTFSFKPTFLKSERTRAILSFSLLTLIILLAFWLRHTTFWLPHWVGDQSHYISLADKLDKKGVQDFSLQGVDVGFIDFDPNKVIRIVYPVISNDPDHKGRMLEALNRAGITYYDQPFYHKPYGFPYMLMISHKLFAPNKKLYTIVHSVFGNYVRTIRPSVFVKTQFWAVIVPLSFSLGLVFLSYLLGALVFSREAGLYAAFLIAINPIDIMTSQKIWADDMLSFFVCLSIILFIKAFYQKNKLCFFLSGIACGISVLAKQTGGYFVFAVYAILLLQEIKSMHSFRSILKGLCNWRFMLFLTGLVLACGHWFFTVYKVFGNPLYLPGAVAEGFSKDITGWFKALSERPPGYVLFFIGLPFLCPLLSGYLFSVRALWRDVVVFFTEKKINRVLFLWIILGTFFIMLFVNNEYRRLLPVFPVMGVLTGYMLEKLRKLQFHGKFKVFSDYKVLSFIIFLMLCCCAIWSSQIGMDAAITRVSLLKKPF